MNGRSGPPSRTGATLGREGESAALARILPRLGSARASLVGPGDDAAVLTAAGPIVATTDTMVHGPDFRLAWSAPFQLGWKAAATNLSDVAAMGARPTALLVALTAPQDTELAVLEELADGLRAGCEELAPGCTVVGGDLAVSPTLTIAVTALGDLDGKPAIQRSGARPGDILAIAGDVGLAGAGLSLLFARGVDAEGNPSAEAAAALRPEFDRILDAQLSPRSPIGAGLAAAEAGATSMIDISDGLVKDAGRVARASGVQFVLAPDALAPTEPGVTLDHVLYGGEDHALLATFPPGATLPSDFRRIGIALAGSGVVLDGTPLHGRGWDPYAGWDGAAG